ncbi:MAG: IPT/TIG domain-containing protein [Anaerolineales bacterium]|nr:IPT/TIG domain-containing protein [Anaerolineales bacterium]
MMQKRVFAILPAILVPTLVIFVIFSVLGEARPGLVSLAQASTAQITPTLSLIEPLSAANDMDTEVVIIGSDFISTPMVYMGNMMLEDVQWISATRLEAVVPWGLDAGQYTLTVENPGGETGSLPNAFTVTQGINVWTTDGPYGGSVHHLAMGDPVTTTLYASLGLAGADGFFKSEDSGLTWHNAFPGEVSVQTPLAGYVLKPGDSQTIYLSGRVHTGEKLFRSTNGGQDWDVIWDGGEGLYALGISPGNPEYLYAGSGSTIMRSINGGDSWDAVDDGIPTDEQISILAVHPLTPTIVYAGGNYGKVYKTLDGGENWIQVADLGDGWWSALVVDPHAPERIYASGWHTGSFFARSLDGGANWETMTLEPGSSSVNDIRFHPTISGTLYVIAPGVYRSVDAGTTWEKIPIPDILSEGWSLLLHPLSGLPYFIGHNGRGVLYSENGGIDWETRSDGLAGLRPHEIAVSLADPSQIYVAADEAGAFSSQDGGQSWLAAEGDNLDRGISVVAHPYTPTIAYLGARRDVYTTIDGGQTWTRHELPGLPSNNEMRVHAIAIDPQDPQVIYAGPGTWDFNGGPEYGWLYRSLDAGETWNVLTTTFPISPVTDIQIDPTDSQTIYVSTGRRFLDGTNRGSGILKTTDGGQTWIFVNEGLTARSIACLAIDPENTQVLYAGAVLESDSADSGVYKSVDGGEHWAPVIGGVRVSGLVVDPLDTNMLYMGAYFNGLWRSADGGENWQRDDDPLGQLSIESLHITTIPSRTILYAGVAGNLLLEATPNAALSMPYTADQEQFYGSGVYHLVIDRRSLLNFIYLPMVVNAP